jgi:hypothetical protein
MTLELHILLHPSPWLLNPTSPSFLPFTIFRELPPFQVLSLLHKAALSLTLALEQLAPWYTPQVPAEQVLSRAEISAMNVFGKSTQALVEEVGVVVGSEEGEGRRGGVERLKGDIVREMIWERYRAGKRE